MSAAVLQFAPRERILSLPYATPAQVVAFPMPSKVEPMAKEFYRTGLKHIASGEPVPDREGALWLRDTEWAWELLDMRSRGFIAQIIETLEERPLSALQSKWLGDLVIKVWKKREAAE